MQPLAGIRVLDFTQVAAGPFGAQLLGEMGADVIKIEPLAGDSSRSYLQGIWTFAVNRNKRGIAIDLRTPEGREIVLKLAADADVFFEAFVPGVMARLGLGYEVIRDVNPRTVYCSISGYGQDGPYRKRGGYDPCAQAESGLMAATGEEGRPYVRIGSSVVDYGTGMYAAYGIVLALLARERTGRGQYLEVSLLDTAISWMNPWVTQFSLAGENPRRIGSGHATAAPYQVFETKNSAMFIGPGNEKLWKAFCVALKLEHLMADPRFATMDTRLENREALVAIVQDALRWHTTAELMATLTAAGVPCAPINRVGEVIEDPHVKARNMIVELEWEGTKVQAPGIPIRMSDTPGEIKRRAPFLGEHTVEILEEIGYPGGKIRELLEKKVIGEQCRISGA